jgi:hypothetical protein
MTALTTILLLAAFIFVESTSADEIQKSPSSLEPVLINENVVLSTTTNISSEMVLQLIRNTWTEPK